MTDTTREALERELEQLAVCLDDWARKARADGLGEEEANHEHFAKVVREARAVLDTRDCAYPDAVIAAQTPPPEPGLVRLAKSLKKALA